MSELSTNGRHFVNLMANWGKGMSPKQLSSWENSADGVDPAIIEMAVRACIRDPERTFEPKGWSEFARYLPSQSSQGVERAYGGGDFIGDWGAASVRSLLIAVVQTMVWGDRIPSRVQMLCREKGIGDGDVRAGVNACKDGGSVAVWVDSWLTGASGHGEDAGVLAGQDGILTL